MMKTAPTKSISLILIVIIAFVVGLIFLWISYTHVPNTSLNSTSKTGVANNGELRTFTSDQDFKSYLQQAQQLASNGGFQAFSSGVARTDIAPKALSAPAEGIAPQAADQTIDRVSQTNVQVAGVDEPDIVKTDGKDIYFSSDQPVFYPLEGGVRPMNMGVSSGSAVSNKMIIAPAPGTPVRPPVPLPTAQTKVIATSPLAVAGKIDKQGDLLLSGKTLVVFSNNEINGFDVSQEASPSAKWSMTLDNNNQVVTSRLLNNKIYLITRTGINYSSPCPYQPLSSNGAKIAIPCVQIYHPINPTSIDSTYTISVINPDTGNVETNVSFVGSMNQTAIYMSQNNLYVSYLFNTDTTTFMENFYQEKGQGLIPQQYLDKLKKLETYDISLQAKQVEQNVILDDYRQTLSDDDRTKFENELQNRLKDYTNAHLRDLEKTGIVRIGLSDMRVDATGVVAGQLLNQFSMDEYQDHLRVATTVSGNMVGAQVSANDVLVLDNNLKTVGALQNLGQDERIYSVRFINDKGYLVTFKQTDPFFVLDLSNPNSPQVKGQLKIPGFSSYLDPLTNNRILGVGQEDGKVKLSLFDITDPNNPQELDHYSMNEYWTDVSNNHHAFLKDDTHKAFFIPGGNGGYVFSYDGDKFNLEKAITGYQIKRALYINDFLYVLGDQKIVVLNEKDWSQVSQLQF